LLRRRARGKDVARGGRPADAVRVDVDRGDLVQRRVEERVCGAVFRNAIEPPLAGSAGEQAAVFSLGDGADVRVRRVVEDLALAFRAHAEELSFDAGGDGDLAAVERLD